MLCLPQEMLAGAEADLEPHIVNRRGEVAARIASRFERQGELRQKRFEETLLMRGKLGPFAPAENPSWRAFRTTFISLRHAEARALNLLKGEPRSTKG